MGCGPLGLPLLLRRIMNQTPKAIKTSRATPPITPPTIAPIGVLLSWADSGLTIEVASGVEAVDLTGELTGDMAVLINPISLSVFVPVKVSVVVKNTLPICSLYVV